MKKKQSTSSTKKVRRGDQVLVIAGNYKGDTGKVLRIDNDKVTVQGVNVRKKHSKATQQNPKGDIISIERPIHISNIRVCDEKNNPIRLHAKTNKDGEKTFVYNQDNKEIVYRSVKKSEK